MDSNGVDGMNGSQNPPRQRAAQFNPVSKVIEINEIPIPSNEPHELLVKVKSASLCHSDLMLFEPNEQNLAMGDAHAFTMGHEGCGTILKVGRNVEGFHEGENIGWLPIVGACYECVGCLINPVNCETGKQQVRGFTVDGDFQEYVAIDWRNAAKIPDGMDLENLSPLFCAGCTSFNSVMDTAAELKGNPEETWIAVVGCGGLGHLGIQYLKASGYKVIGIDLSSDALEEAKAQGADYVFNPKSDTKYTQQIREITGKGCHAAINYTNSVPAYSGMPAILRMNGILMVTGIPQKPLEFSAMDISMGRIRVLGSNNGTTDRLQRCVDFSHKHGIKPHMTDFKLEQIQEMVDLMQSGQHKGRMGVVFQ